MNLSYLHLKPLKLIGKSNASNFDIRKTEEPN